MLGARTVGSMVEMAPHERCCPDGGGRHGPRQNRMIADSRRRRDETNLPATKHFRACDEKIPKPSPRSSPLQRGATPAQELGRSIAATPSEKGTRNDLHR